MAARQRHPSTSSTTPTAIAAPDVQQSSTESFVASGSVPEVSGEPLQQHRRGHGGTPSASDQAYGAPTERAELIAQTRTHLGNAYTAFTGACLNVKIELLEAANADADMMAVVGTVLFGLALPGVGAALGPVLGKLASVAPKAAHAISSNHKLIEEAVKGAGEIGLEVYKEHIPQMRAAHDADEFITELNANTQVGIQAMQDHLPERSTEEIAALWAAYDATVTNMPAFTAKIRRLVQAFQAVQQIGHKTERKFGRGGDTFRLTERTILAYVGDPAVEGNKLAVVEQLDGLGGAGDHFTIVDYVPDELREMAIAKHGGGEPGTFDPRTNRLTRR